MSNGIGKVYTTRIQKSHFSGLGVYDPNKVFTRNNTNGKVFVNDILSSICKKDEAITIETVDINGVSWSKDYISLEIGEINPDSLSNEIPQTKIYNGIYYYNIPAVLKIENDNLIPGFHVANYTEWSNLATYAGGLEIAGKKLKSVDYNGTDDYGMNITNVGYFNSSMVFANNATRIWTKTQQANLNYSFANFTVNDAMNLYNVANSMFVIRLVKD